jgi:hypothetical protein
MCNSTLLLISVVRFSFRVDPHYYEVVTGAMRLEPNVRERRPVKTVITTCLPIDWVQVRLQVCLEAGWKFQFDCSECAFIVVPTCLDGFRRGTMMKAALPFSTASVDIDFSVSFPTSTDYRCEDGKEKDGKRPLSFQR